MHQTLPAITLCAALSGCSPAQAPGDVQKPVAVPERPVESVASPTVVVPKVWQLRLTSQFLGTAAGPLQMVAIDSNGPVRVEVDGQVVGQSVLTAAEPRPFAANPRSRW